MNPSNQSNWLFEQLVTYVQMDAFGNDVYDKLTALTQNLNGGILNLQGSISISGGNVNLPAGSFRFPDATYSYLPYQTGIFGFAAAQTVAFSGNGYIVARYTITPQAANATNYLFLTGYYFVTTPSANDCVVCAITGGAISSYGNFLINTAASQAEVDAGIISNKAVVPSTLATFVSQNVSNATKYNYPISSKSSPLTFNAGDEYLLTVAGAPTEIISYSLCFQGNAIAGSTSFGSIEIDFSLLFNPSLGFGTGQINIQAVRGTASSVVFTQNQLNVLFSFYAYYISTPTVINGVTINDAIVYTIKLNSALPFVGTRNTLTGLIATTNSTNIITAVNPANNALLALSGGALTLATEGVVLDDGLSASYPITPTYATYTNVANMVDNNIPKWLNGVFQDSGISALVAGSAGIIASGGTGKNCWVQFAPDVNGKSLIVQFFQQNVTFTSSGNGPVTLPTSFNTTDYVPIMSIATGAARQSDSNWQLAPSNTSVSSFSVVYLVGTTPTTQTAPLNFIVIGY